MLRFRLNFAEKRMNTQIFMTMVVALLMLTCNVQGNSASVLWNDQCPPSFAKTMEEGKSLKREIPDFHRDFRLQLGWQGGKICKDPNVCKDPNELITKEILLIKKIVDEVFRPQIISPNTIDSRILFLSNVSFKSGKNNAMVFRFKKDKYIVKIMKTLAKKGKSVGTLFITIRPVSNDPIDRKLLAEEIFNNRILPAKYERPFYCPKLKRQSKVLSAGAWMARETWRIGDSGEIIDADAHIRRVDGDIGNGRYRRIDFYTNGKFACFRITAGPNRKKQEVEQDESLSRKKHETNHIRRKLMLNSGFMMVPFSAKTDPNSMPPP